MEVQIAISKKIEECVLASAWIKPETQIFDSSELYKIVNPVAPFSFLNGVYRTNFNADKNAEFVEQQISSYRNAGISFRWYCYPHSQPSTLQDKLKAYAPADITEMEALYLSSFSHSIKIAPTVSVEPQNLDNIEAYADTNNAGWSHRGPEADRVKNEIIRDFKSGTNYRAFLARYEGKPAGTCCLRIVQGEGYLFGTSVAPEFRGKGVYRSMVAHRLSLLEKEGVDQALILARKKTSAPICRKLGFKWGCDVNCFEFIL